MLATYCEVRQLTFAFLTCVSHSALVIDIGWTSVRLSVRHTLVLCQPIVKLSSMPGSPMNLVF